MPKEDFQWQQNECQHIDSSKHKLMNRRCVNAGILFH